MTGLPKKGVVLVTTEKEHDLVLLILNTYGRESQNYIKPFIDVSKFKTFIYWNKDTSYVTVSRHLTINDFNKAGYPLQILEEILKY